MSERSKGDTSSSVAAPPARVVKNPLLSASVTGLTFDDFHNKPLLLPAAPPIIHPVPVVSSRESTPLVTVGKSSDIDTENLSEINLNDLSGSTASNTADTSDENSNSLLEPSAQADNSILSQAATSFSQLPSVASSVFSTFSKKFNSARDDINSNPNSQLDIQPFSTHAPQLIYPPATTFANQEQQQQPNTTFQSAPQLPVDPPTFYSPTEVPTVPSAVSHPPIPSGQNTYRISARKKIYAPIPGLSSAHQENNFPSAAASYLPPIGLETLPIPVYTEQSAAKPEENKGGLFSLSNLVPGVPSVFQNLSGLVQSAAGSLTQKLQEQPQLQQPADNSFAPSQVDTIGQSPSSFFTPGSQGNTLGATQNSQQSDQNPPPVNFFPPAVVEATQALPQSSVQGQVQPAGHFFTTLPPNSGFVGQTFKHLPPPSSGILFPGQSVQSTNPTNVAPNPPIIPSAQPISTGALFAGQPPQSTTPTNIPLVASGPPLASFGQQTQADEQFVSQQLPLQAPSTKPPSGGPPSSSFRLQKGTRLYKSPFAAAPCEYKPQPISGYTPPALQSFIPPTQLTTDVFTPFNSLQQGSVPYQGYFPPFVPQTDAVSSTILVPTTATGPSKVLPRVFNPGPESSQDSLPLLVPGQEITQRSTLQSTLAQTSQFAAPPLAPERKSLTAPTIATDSIPLNTVQEADVSTFVNPLQQAAVASHGTPLEKESVSKTETNPVQEQPTTELPSQGKLFSNQLTEQQPLVPFEISPDQPIKPQTISPEDQALKDFSEVPSTIGSVNAFETNQPPLQDSLKSVVQTNFGQSNQLPPPPTVGVGIQSKETANFPPPPPQHSFQNKANSNPYRKGLQSHHSQLASPASLSTFFTPSDQDFNLFQPIVSEAVNPPLTGTPPIASFFGSTSGSETFAKVPHISTDSAIEQLDIADSQPTSAIFTPIPPSAPSPPLSEPILAEIPTLATQTDSVASFFASEAVTSSSQDESEATATPAANLVSFFKAPPNQISAVPPNKLPIKSASQETPAKEQVAAPPPAATFKIASPLDSEQNSESQQSVPNLFTSFFDHVAPTASTAVTPVINQPSLPDPTSFFDSFGQAPSVGVDAAPPEDPNSQRIQNFFNNPPPKDLDPVGDLNYNLVGSGLSVKNLQTRSLTPASNLAEPPSSSCSDFSELNSSVSAANRQPRVPAEDSNKVSPEEGVIFEAADNQDLPEEIINEIKMANMALEKSGAVIPANVVYNPAVKHWFYKRRLDAKHVWTPFSHYDSALLEKAFLFGDGSQNLVAVEGGRYDVNISERTKIPVYWEGEPIDVKRCSWFYKAVDSKYVPYEEQVADLLEEEYKKSTDSCEWHKKIPISVGDMVVFHGPTAIVHFQQQQLVDSWGGSTPDSESFLSYIQQQTSTRPRVVKRDLDDFTIEDGETHKVDHLLYMVHGIGSACDLKMRSVEEVVDEFRGIALQLVQSHYKNSVENGFVGRVEVLPVSWHGELHSDELGIDEKLKSITLESIPKLRNFTNDTLLDILFYTSPMFCQRIMNTVTASMNSIYIKYKARHPDFRGGVSLAGHSLGSLIIFDLLCHQRPLKECDDENMENPDEIASGCPVDSNQLNEDAAKHISYQMGHAGTGQPFISYPQLLFQPKKFFALGSPIGMFVTIRGIDKLGLDFRLPTCPGFYNIFHPYDPVAYRLEALVNSDMNGIPPVLIPHHKGRKRMHLELKETMSRVGADLKQRFFETFKTTFDSVGFLAPKLKSDPKEMEKEVEKVLELQSQQDQQTHQGPSTSRSRADSTSTYQSEADIIEIDFPLGKLNDSKRIDYVLQEAPLEFFNEYLFALSSHVCYWESEDTILFVMKEIYSGIGISTDSQVPQQTMTIERPSSRGSVTQSPTS